jgi:hypothetical protein
MTPLFQTLSYNYDDPHGAITDFSANTIAHLDSIPSLIVEWQSADIANNDVTGYFQNPVGTVSTSIKTSANAIYNIVTANIANSTLTYTNPGVSLIMANVANVSNSLITTASNFYDHTNRVSGVTSYLDFITEAGATIASTKPFKNTVLAYAKSATYVIYQTDEISNTAIMNGSHTSLFTEPELNVYSTLIGPYANTINSSLTVSVSNLTSAQANTIYAGIIATSGFMDTRRNHDETFYTNLVTLVKNYNTVRPLSNMGESERILVNDYTGTVKLLSRINA